MIAFYCDTHIAKQVALQLRTRGITAVRCEEVGLAEADDEQHLAYAVEHGYAVLTKDSDFIRLYNQYAAQGKKHFGIFFQPQRFKPTIGIIVTTCLFYVESLEADAISQNEIEDAVFHIPRER